MKHAREDYNRIQDPTGLIPEDEPVFLIRGQDITAPDAIRSWANRAWMSGASIEMVQQAKSFALDVEHWQRMTGKKKIPDLPPKPTE